MQMKNLGCILYCVYAKRDIMIAREKHSAVAEKKSATEGDICFSAIINEKAFDEVKQEVRKHGLSSVHCEAHT